MTINQLPLDSPDEEPETTIDSYDPARADKWGYTDKELRRCVPGVFPSAENAEDPPAMNLNAVILTIYRWRRLAPELRAALRQVLGAKAGIHGRPVLDLARDLCARGAYELAFALYHGLDGQPPIPYHGCGFGLLMTLRELMGEDPAEIGATLLL